MNRIEAAISRLEPVIANLPAESRQKMDTAANIGFDEYVAFQNAKSLAQASGKLTYDEAVTIFGILGGSPDAFNAKPLTARIVVMKSIMEIAKR